MTNEPIAPEYIVEQAKLLSDEELLCLIQDYGEQERDDASYHAFLDSKDGYCN